MTTSEAILRLLLAALCIEVMIAIVLVGWHSIAIVIIKYHAEIERLDRQEVS